jgi:subtilisin family serine protease
MKKRNLLVLAFTVLFLSFTVTTSFADNWIINSKSKKWPKDFANKIDMAGGKLLKSWDFVGIAVAEFPTEADALVMETADLKVMPDIKISWLPQAEVGPAHIGEDEDFYGYQWHLPRIEADKAWDEGVTGAGVRVAVLDTGIWYPHGDLNDNIDFGSSASFVPGVPDFLDDHWHGTHVAGIIAAEDNGRGCIGVAPNATLIAVKVLNQYGEGAFSWIMNGIVHAVQEDADIINMSLAGYIKKSGCSFCDVPYTSKDASMLLSTMNKLTNWAAKNDVLVISAAGNDYFNLNYLRDWVILPAEAGNSIAISATGPTDLPANYTNHGTSLIWTSAPGGDPSYGLSGWVLSTINDIFGPNEEDWYAFAYGTSQAAPCAAGVAALIIEKYGPMNVGTLKNHLAQTADDLGKPGRDHFYGRGRVNANKAVTKK